MAISNGVIVDEQCPDSIPSISLLFPDNSKFIGIGKEQTEYTRLERVAHEVGHCLTNAFYLPYTPQILRGQYEHTANVWAVNKIIPFDRLKKEVMQGYTEIWQLAEYFGVSNAFIQKAIQIYEQKGKTIKFDDVI